MKKLTTITFALFLTMSLAACSSSDNGPPADDPPVSEFVPIDGDFYILQTLAALFDWARTRSFYPIQYKGAICVTKQWLLHHDIA